MPVIDVTSHEAWLAHGNAAYARAIPWPVWRWLTWVRRIVRLSFNQ